MSVTLFLLSFVAGPAIFWLLARQRANPAYFVGLVVASTVLASGAYLVPRIIGESATAGAFAVLMLWLGWIMVLALCALAVRARFPVGIASKLAFAFCAMATTLPWFGLYAASMIGT
jgi:hypothetical protein